MLYYEKYFSTQIDEATDCSGTLHSIAQVPHTEAAAINEDVFSASVWKGE
jgi:hypothetical protein